MRKISLEKILMTLLLIPFFKPVGLECFGSINLIFKFYKFISIIYIIFALIASKDYKVNKCFIALAVFWGIYIVNSAIYNTLDTQLIINAVISVLIVQYLTIKFKKNKGFLILDSLEIIFTILIIGQILSIFYINLTGHILFADIGNDYTYFLGTDNYSAFSIFPMIVIIIYNNYLQNGKIWKGKGLYLLFAIMSAYFFTNSVTAAFSFLLFLIILILYKYSSIIIKKISIKKIIIVLILLLILIEKFNIQNLFANFLINGAKKDLTLNSRTIIWKNAINLILKKPLLGYGTLSKAAINSYVLYGVEHAHNIILELLLRTGIIGFINYIIFLSGCFINRNGEKNSNILRLGLIILLFLSFMDFYPSIICQYFLIGILYNVKYIEKKEV